MSGGIRFGWPWHVPICASLSLAVLVLGAPSAVQAGTAEYCVTCKTPNATYRCRLQGSGVTQSDAFKLYCVVRTTKEGNHASCGAKRDPNCAGVVKVYNYEGPTLPGNVTGDRRLQDFNRRVDEQNRAFEDTRGDQPNSLFELGGRAVDASRRGLQGAGAAIGLGAGANEQAAPPQAPPPPPAAQPPAEPKKNFARRSWDCMVSLFRECGDQ
ncbi:MAG: hypothetical protein AAF967_04910 [Pseudomonadota bacterium]